MEDGDGRKLYRSETENEKRGVINYEGVTRVGRALNGASSVGGGSDAARRARRTIAVTFLFSELK